MKYKGEVLKGWAVMRGNKVKKSKYGRWILLLGNLPCFSEVDEPNLIPVTIRITPRPAKPAKSQRKGR